MVARIKPVDIAGDHPPTTSFSDLVRGPQTSRAPAGIVRRPGFQRDVVAPTVTVSRANGREPQILGSTTMLATSGTKPIKKLFAACVALGEILGLSAK
jgi:hypothetical protein